MPVADKSRKRVSILGSTGSVGTTALELIAKFSGEFEIVALAAGNNVALLKRQISAFQPSVVSVARESDAAELRAALGPDGPAVHHGADGLTTVATAPADILLSALVGAVGLEPSLAAIDAGLDLALANKEVMVVAGELMRSHAHAKSVKILPVDSEHNAIFQALQGRDSSDVRKLRLTASGGPFREHSRERLRTVTRQEALDHPTWDMGDKITIDSATLMNKGLEVIEARWLFDTEQSNIDVVIHPQSIVHSMVEYRDGTVVAVMAIPDMSIPVAYCLSYPHVLDLGYLPALDLTKAGALTFFPPDLERFPCLGLAYEALEAGGTMPAVANAANEIAVSRFLADDISFMDIPALVADTMRRHEPVAYSSVTDLLAADAWARDHASKLPSQLAAG